MVRWGPEIHQQRSHAKDAAFPGGDGGDKATLLHRAAHNWNEAGVQTLLGLGAACGDRTLASAPAPHSSALIRAARPLQSAYSDSSYVPR